MKIFKQCLCAAALTGLAFSVPLTAQAAIQLTLSDGTVAGTVTVVDGGVGDLNAGVGIITFIGSVGVWNVSNVTTGITSPPLIAPELLDLNTVNLSSAAGGTMTITLSSTDYSGPFDGVIAADLSVQTAGTVAYDLWANADNGMDSMLTSIVSGTVAAPGGFVTGSGAFSSPGDFSLTEQVVITHTGSGTTSLDFLAKVPEPGTLALLGIGLVGLGFGARRKNKAA